MVPTKFDDLVKALQKSGYKVTVKKEDGYTFANIKGGHIYAGFCSPTTSKGVYTYINGKISADHKECFDKWSKCPLNLPLPENEEQMDFLLKQLIFWGSPEGYKKSNEYNLDSWIKEYPA